MTIQVTLKMLVLYGTLLDDALPCPTGSGIQ